MTPRLALAWTLALALSSSFAKAEDLKKIGEKYRIKVTSAGVPTLGGVTSGYTLRTRYEVRRGDKTLGSAYLGDPVFVPEPGEYEVIVNGRSTKLDFDIPAEMTADRIKASWQRQRPIELRPRELGQRLAIPSLWVIHPPEVTGDHNDDYTIHSVNASGTTSKAIVKGVALVYAPEEAKDVDDGMLYANTLVHLMPGDYELRINGCRMRFELAAGEARLLRLSALKVQGPLPIAQSGAEKGKPHSPQQSWGEGKDRKRFNIAMPALDTWFVVTPGRYLIAEQGLVVAEARALTLAYDATRVKGLARPRLGIRAEVDWENGGVTIKGFVDDSPAAAAGLKVGDRIIAIGEVKIFDNARLAQELRARKPGDKVQLKVIREGREGALEVEVTLGGEKDDPKPEKSEPKKEPKGRPF